MLPFYKALGCAAILSVNVTTWKDGKLTLDSACILQAGDHPFIKHKSFCFYAGAIPLKVSRVEQWVDSGKLKDCGRLREDVLNRVVKGLDISENLSSEAEGFLRELSQFSKKSSNQSG